MFIIFALIDGHFLLTLELKIIDGEQRVCYPKPWARHFVGNIFVFIDALKYSAIPFCISFVLSILIIQRVFRAENISAQLQSKRYLQHYRHCSMPSTPNFTGRSSTSGTSASNSTTSSNTRVGRRVTFMLLSVSIAFCFFSAPMSLMQIVQSISKPGSNETALAIAKAIAELCQYVNHSCNFFLYALTGRVFRREFVRLFFPTRIGGGRTLVAVDIGRIARRSVTPQANQLVNRPGSLCSIDKHRGNSYQRSKQRSSHQTDRPLRLAYANSSSLTASRIGLFSTHPSHENTVHAPTDDTSLLLTIRTLIGPRRQSSEAPFSASKAKNTLS